MIQGVLFILAVIIVILFFKTKESGHSTKNKIAFVGIVVVVIIFTTIYEQNASNTIDQNREALQYFNQGKSLQCNGQDVDNQNFLYVSGTQSFSGKPNNKAVEGLVFDIRDCKIR
jgi:multisubunit Na+/H+ antiporter MnhB subunit